VLLDGRDEGVWCLTTASGARHILDLDARTYARCADRPWEDEGQEYLQAALRRGGEPLPLLAFSPVLIGERCLLSLGGVDTYKGYLHTYRHTTPVVACRRIGPSDIQRTGPRRPR
jgi:hypothetical protein